MSYYLERLLLHLELALLELTVFTIATGGRAEEEMKKNHVTQKQEN